MHYFSVINVNYKRHFAPVMISSAISYKNSVIHYLKAGSGERLLFFFHGYGETAASFTTAAEKLGHHFTIIAMDLPFHGKTGWHESLVVKPGELMDILDAIAARESKRLNKWLISGYSLGGRIALMILQLMPERINRVVLLAPDGFKINGWYWLATQSYLGNRLFRYTMKNPGWFMRFLSIGNRLKVVNQSIYKFAISYLQDPGIRMDLYQRWTGLREFRPDVGKIKKIVLKENILVDLVYGRFDRIIRYEHAEKFRSGIEEQTRLILLDAGHQLFHPKTIDAITRVFTE
jgi:pimeloyl-ACP methyl ester carboxylesterase